VGTTMVVDAGKRASLYVDATRQRAVHLLQVNLSVPPHQLARLAAATRHEGGGERCSGDEGGPARAVAIRGAWMCLPKVLPASAGEVPRDAACRSATTAPHDAVGHRVATPPPAAAAPPP
jgi:hypothetical protein